MYTYGMYRTQYVFLWYVWEYTGSIPGVYRKYTGSIPGVYREYTGSIPGVFFMKFSEFFQQIFSTNFYLVTIASFRIGVPSILFFLTVGQNNFVNKIGTIQ